MASLRDSLLLSVGLLSLWSTPSLADDLRPSYVYRADMLSPEHLKLQGRFFPRGMDGTRPSQTLASPKISLFDHVRGLPSGTSRFDSGYVSTTRSIDFARRFLHTSLGSQGYIYKMHVSPNFIDTAHTLGQFYAQSEEQEVSVLGGPLYSQVLSWIEFRQGVEQPEKPNPDYDSSKFDDAVWGGVQYQLAGFPDDHVAWKIEPWRRYSDCGLSDVERCKPRRSSLQFAIEYADKTDTKIATSSNDDGLAASSDRGTTDSRRELVGQADKSKKSKEFSTRNKANDSQKPAASTDRKGKTQKSSRRICSSAKSSRLDLEPIPEDKTAHVAKMGRRMTDSQDVVYLGDYLKPSEAKQQGGLLPAVTEEAVQRGKRTVDHLLTAYDSFAAAAKDAVRKAITNSHGQPGVVYTVRATPNMVKRESSISIVGGVRWHQVLGWSSIPQHHGLKDMVEKIKTMPERNPSYDNRFDNFTLFNGPTPNLNTVQGLLDFMQHNGRAVGWKGEFPLFKCSRLVTRDFSRLSRGRKNTLSPSHDPALLSKAWSWLKRQAAYLLPVVDAVSLIPPVGEIADGFELETVISDPIEAEAFKGVEMVADADEVAAGEGEDELAAFEDMFNGASGPPGKSKVTQMKPDITRLLKPLRRQPVPQKSLSFDDKVQLKPFDPSMGNRNNDGKKAGDGGFGGEGSLNGEPKAGDVVVNS
ncbi:putative enterotoxin [Ophiocordyceps unilateralis]|uniref:Enterotoxin n=1 Tax=Ophiocordyceps unilateralis TaxID=268505 RepID=A0A2A9PN90_OPHUN|nr:putative enterotoxin [Ophiocordyceps unilateralis]